MCFFFLLVSSSVIPKSFLVPSNKYLALTGRCMFFLIYNIYSIFCYKRKSLPEPDLVTRLLVLIREKGKP